MKKTLILVLFLGLFFIVQATSISVPSTAGGLSSAITAAGGNLTTTTNLTVTGTIDVRDFVTMRDNMPLLAVVDLSGANIATYTGVGTSGTASITYLANKIPDNAFCTLSGKAKTSLKSITMPSTVTSIGNYAFSDCSGFTGSLTIPSTVTSIGNFAFNSCSGFTGSLTIPSSVTFIGNSAFNSCTGFTGSLTIPLSVTSIGEYTFSNCKSFTGSLTIPSSVTTIGYAAFSYCNGFNGSLTIPSSVTTIGYAAFNSCSGFTGSLTIPSSVTTIGNSAFSDCSGFTGSLTIPSSVTSIGNYAFNSCSGFTGSLTIPSSVTSIGESTFSNCRSFTGSLTIPSSVTTIGNSAFSYCSGFTGSLTIPSSVTSIGESAFFYCNGLITVDMANLNYSSADGVLFNKDKTTLILCSTFKSGSYTIPSSVTTIEDYAFSNCSRLTGSLIIPSSVTSIGFLAFFYCNVIITVDMANPNYSSGDGVLFNKDKTTLIFCPQYKTENYTIPTSVTTIGDYAFNVCSRLTGSLTIPSSVTSIGNHAFYGCSGFTGSLTIPTSVTFIGKSAFYGCRGFTGSLTIPTSVTSIGEYAFFYCNGIITVDIANPNYSSGDGVLFNKDKTTLIFCPQYKTENYTIPTSVTTIGVSAFYDCNELTGSLTIPSSVTSIGNSAFLYCSKLSSIIAYGTTPSLISLGEGVFIGVSTGTCKLYVPVGTKTLYAAAEQWKDFMITDGTPTIATQAVSDINITVATGNANIIDFGISNLTSYGICWNKTGSPTISDNKVDKGTTSIIGTFSAAMEELTANTIYFVRAFATNTRGTSYGNEVTFTTLDIAPHISYLTPLTYTVGIPITALTPTNTGGAVPAGSDSVGFVYTVSPALPTGLSFDRATGTINGTPTVTNAATTYTVTAANSGGCDTTNISITVKNPQTITFSALPAKTYGDASYNLTATTSSGLGLSYSSDNTAVATVSDTTIIIVGVGTANITVSQAGNATYAAAPNITQQLTVNKKALMVTATVDTKTYDGTTASTGAPTVGTLVAGDVINVSPTQVFDHATVGIRVLTASGLTIKNSCTDVTGNYDISYTSATGTINKFSLSVTAISDTKTYDGTTASTRTPIVGTLVAGDLINVSPTQAFDNATVGTRVLTASGLIIKNSNTDVTGNYNIQYIAVNGSISAKILTIKEPVVTLNKNYDGTTLATVTVGALSGVVARDEGNIAVTAAANYDNATVGVNKTIRVIYTLVGSAANNYIAPADYVIAGARILETIKLNLLSTPTPGCEGTDMQLAYSVLSGTPTQYKINFDAAAQTAGMQNVNYTNLISFGENGVVSFTLPTKIKYGTYHGTLQMKSEFGIESSVYNFQFTIKVSSDYIIPKFDDVLLCDNSSNTFTAYQWYKDGVAIAGATEQFYNDHILDGSYSLKLTTTDGMTVYSCDKVLTASKAKKVNAYPSPLKVSEICTVKMIGFSIEDLEGASLSVYTTQGICVYHSTKVENVNLISLPPMAGMYLGSVVTEKGQRTQFKIIVVE